MLVSACILLIVARTSLANILSVSITIVKDIDSRISYAGLIELIATSETLS